MLSDKKIRHGEDGTVACPTLVSSDLKQVLPLTTIFRPEALQGFWGRNGASGDQALYSGNLGW